MFFMCLQQEIHSFSTIRNGSRPRGSIATAIKTPWSDGARKPIKIDVSKISCQPQARLVKPSQENYFIYIYIYMCSVFLIPTVIKGIPGTPYNSSVKSSEAQFRNTCELLFDVKGNES